jgi:molybdopterin-guanine dinucleotide biosynthesis protein A
VLSPQKNPSQVRCAAILAGGKSSRMGREKALIEVEGQPLVARVAAVLAPIFPQICVVTAQSGVARAAGYPAITDTHTDHGPLGGIHAALTYFGAPTFIVACDMPFLNSRLIEYMTSSFEGSALVPEGVSGPEPLHAIYSHALVELFETQLRSDMKTPSLRRILSMVQPRFIPLETVQIYDMALRCFANWNSPDDIEGAQQGA